MSEIDKAIAANRQYEKDFKLADLPIPPARKLAIVTCMDSRMDLEQLLGLKPGDAHMIRNAGGIVTEDALRSLLISHYVTGTQEFIVINHTDCGMQKFKEAELRARLQKETQTAVVAPSSFLAFSDLEENVRQQMQKLRTHPWMPKGAEIRGFVYDVKTGRLNEVLDSQADAATR